jgi:hypothetical protein
MVYALAYTAHLAHPRRSRFNIYADLRSHCVLFTTRKPIDSYSQTFEKRSSLAANPPGFFETVLEPGVTGAALFHPPKSSSTLTFGGAETAGLNPPRPPGTVLWFVSEPPDPHPKSLALACTGGGCLVTGEVTLAGPLEEELHASFEPQASVLFQPLKAGDVLVWDGVGCLADRLKMELC